MVFSKNKAQGFDRTLRAWRPRDRAAKLSPHDHFWKRIVVRLIFVVIHADRKATTIQTILLSARFFWDQMIGVQLLSSV